jgi:Ribbon-helix-helix protein, copG family
MGAPTKPRDKLKTYRGYFYLTPELDARLKAESARRGGASRSDIVRSLLNRVLPRVDVTIAERNVGDIDSS